MAQKRKSLKRSNLNRKLNRNFGRSRRKSRMRSTRASSLNGRVFEWSSVFPKASIKTKTRFNLKNDWGLKVKGVLNV